MKTLLLLSMIMLTACGMQGDLYLPNEGSANEPEQSANKISIRSSSHNAIQKT
ncbi:MAG: lipoprotein [Gammaproteobacteria bacterium]|nr:lipoprotein [Gammaproteobacteria bacterium]